MRTHSKHGIGAGRPVILQLAGGTGDGPVGEVFEALLKVERPVELVVVAGKNAELKAELARGRRRRGTGCGCWGSPTRSTS
jgi:hypothetical protein